MAAVNCGSCSGTVHLWAGNGMGLDYGRLHVSQLSEIAGDILLTFLSFEEEAGII